MKSSIKRQPIGYSLVAAIVVVACVVPFGRANAAQYSMRYAMQKVPEDFVYRASDWGKKYNLDVTTLVSPSGSRSMQHLLSGQADCADSGSGPILRAMSRAPNKMVIVSATHSGGQRHELMVKPSAKYSSLADLKGKNIAIRVGSGAYIAFKKYLDAKGWSDQDFNVVNMAPGDMGAAISSGQVAGAVTWEPTPSLLTTKDVVKVIQDFGGVTSDPALLVCNTEFVNKHPKALKRFLASNSDMYHFINTNPKAAGKRAAKVASKSGVTVPPAAFTRAFKHMTFDMKLSSENIKDLKSNGEFMVKNHRIPSVPDIKSLINMKYLKAAQKMSE